MHSRIFGIVKIDENYEENKEKLSDITDDDVYEKMREIADYVTDIGYSKSDFNWLKECYDVFMPTTKNKFKISKFKLEQWVWDKFNKFKILVNSLQKPIDLFTRSYALTSMLNDKDGFYIIDADGWIITFDEFLYDLYKRIIRDKTDMIDETYEILNIFDYHF